MLGRERVTSEAASGELPRVVDALQEQVQQGRILMERHKLTGEQAFALLIRASQHSNVKLRDVAEQLVRSGALAGNVQPPTP